MHAMADRSGPYFSHVICSFCHVILPTKKPTEMLPEGLQQAEPGYFSKWKQLA